MKLSTELQEKALEKACRSVGLAFRPKYMKNKNDTATYADKVAAFFYHENMVVKQSFMYCDNLDMTFFFDKEGKARISYSGHSGNDSIEDIIEAFKKADILIQRMDEAMAELTQEKEQDEIEMGE